MTAGDALTRFVDARTPDWLGWLQSLIRERSVFEHEHGIVELVAARIAAIGLTPVRVSHDAARLRAIPGAQPPFSSVEGRCSLVVRVPGLGGGRSIAFNTHLDIVPEGDARAWTHPPFDGLLAGDTIVGRGAMDDKAGVAIALAVLDAMVNVPIRVRGDVVFHFVLEDENTGNGSLLCLDAGHSADGAVIIDGTRLDRAIDRHAGQLQFDVHVTGRPASVSVSHLGVNAADLLARLVARLADRVGALNQERIEPWTQFPSPFQLVTQRLASDGAALTVPERAEGTCYVTFPPPWTLAKMSAFLETETRAFASERGVAAVPVLTGGFSTEPVASEAGALCAALVESAGLEGIGAVEIGPSTGTSDLRHFAAARIPCVLYGPGNGFNPHRPDEYYRVNDLPRMVKLFVRLARRWCGSE